MCFQCHKSDAFVCNNLAKLLAVCIRKLMLIYLNFVAIIIVQLLRQQFVTFLFNQSQGKLKQQLYCLVVI